MALSRKITLAMILALSAGLGSRLYLSHAADAPPAAAALVGAWRLVSIDERGPDGRPTEPLDYGASPIGLLIYDAAGNMSVHAMRRGRPKLDTEDVHRVPAEQAKTALVGYGAYFGTYSVDFNAGLIVHHVQGALLPNWEGSQQRRRFTLVGDTLTLEPPEFQAGGQKHWRRLTWQRVR